MRAGRGSVTVTPVAGPPWTGAFDAFVGALDPPMFIVTARAADDGETAGCLIGFATQASIRPRRLLVCVSVVNHTHRVAARAGVVAVHRLRPDQRRYARAFGARTGDETDTFAGIAWTPGPQGVPVLDGVPGVVVGRILARLPLGDHTGLLLDPVEVRDDGTPGQLGMRAARDIPPGHPA